LETVNTLIEVQIEKNPLGRQRKMVLRRMLRRLLQLRPAGEFCALLGIAVRGYEETEKHLEHDAANVLKGLKTQGLLRDGKLRQWAMYLQDDDLRLGLFGEGLPTAAQLTKGWSARVEEVVKWVPRRSLFALVGDELWDEIVSASNVVLEGQVARAREILDGVERRMAGSLPFPARVQVGYRIVRARILEAEGQTAHAEASLWEAARVVEGGEVPADLHGILKHELAVILRQRGDLQASETALRDALRLAEQGGDTSKSRGITMRELGRTLLARGQLEAAETALREALQLMEQGGARPISRAIGLTYLGTLLQQRGQLEASETALQDALQLVGDDEDARKERALILETLAQVKRAQQKL
jgi:tetratricopeptide (TPR) repeat protein